MTDWRVGMKVVCVDDSLLLPVVGRSALPKRGGVYTIRSIFKDPFWGNLALHLFEVRNPVCRWDPQPFESGFGAHRFRPVINPEADLSEFEAILRGVEKREVVDA